MRLSRTSIMTAAGALLVLGAVISPAAAAQSGTAGPARHPGVIRLSPGTAGRIQLASVNGQCSTWTDYVTFGVGCKNLPGWNIWVQAFCQNGGFVKGSTESGTSNVKSYAYCSSKNSTIKNVLFVAYPVSGGPMQRRAEASRVRQRARAALAAVADQRHRGSVPQASVNGNCLVWSDGTTFGSACDAMLGWFYQAQATCKNGKIVTGPTQLGSTLDWSYAYCSSVNSTVKNGYVYFSF